jgi:L-serine kinase (ADP)
MTQAPEFELVPIEELKSHEEIDEENVVDLVKEISRAGVFADPIWAARGSLVILNGHHRVEALRRLGARRVPAWLLDYETDAVSLEPWRPGLPITKAEVVRRGLGGHLFPPKTTRHKLRVELPPHPTPLAELVPGSVRRESQRRSGDRSMSPRAGASGSR